MNKIRKYFEIEKKRDFLAKKGDFVSLRKTYLVNDITIADLNNNFFWDRLIEGSRSNLLLSPIYKDKIDIISNFLMRKLGRLLDIGFGYADVERVLRKGHSKLEFYGVDISRVAVEKARKEIGGRFTVADITNITNKGSFFDFVLALDVLEHLSPEKVLKVYSEIKRVLKKDGYFIASVPLNEGLEKMLLNGKNPNGHLRAYTPELIKAELEMSGFKVVKTVKLFAYSNFYKAKSFLNRLFLEKLSGPNLIILFAQK